MYVENSFYLEDEEKMEIIDKTETNLVALRRTIYLTIQSRYFDPFKILHLSSAIKYLTIKCLIFKSVVVCTFYLLIMEYKCAFHRRYQSSIGESALFKSPHYIQMQGNPDL